MASLCSSRIVRAKELAKRLDVAEVTVWRWERKGRLPPKRKLGPNVAGWLETDLEEWFSSKVPGACVAQ